MIIQDVQEAHNLAAQNGDHDNSVLMVGSFEIQPTGLVVHGQPDIREWMAVGEVFKQLETAIQWVIGDWLLYGEGRGDWGEMYSQALEATAYEYKTLRNYAWVSSNVELSLRRDNLSFSHHKEVTALEPEQQDYYLDLAVSDNLSVSKLRDVIRRDQFAKSPPIPEGQYSVIYADPPWQFANSGLTGGAEDHYPTMSTDDICAMQIPATDTAVLFLWSTNPMLPDALQVCEAWGFTYKTKFVWDKERETYGKIGFYGYSQTEDLLICTRGSFVPEHKPVLFIRERKQEHSRKPLMYTTIEAMYPDQQYLELFARNQPPREGWTFWGNQA